MGHRGSSKGFRRGKKGWSKGESRDVLKFSTKEAGKGGRPENYKQVRLKLQSDRLNRGWRDQPAHGKNKGRGRPQLVVHPRNDFCADHSRENSCAGTLETNPVLTMTRNVSSANVDSRNLLCVEGDFQRDDETFLGVRKDDVTFLDVQTDGVTLPVPGSSSSFSLGSVVVVGSRENQCRDVKLESGGGAEHNMSEPLVNSPETKRLMEIASASGASVRTAYKAVRKRL